MTLETVIAAVDGSDAASEAVRAGLALLQPAARVLVVTVVEHGDPSLVTGSGFAGGVMSEEEFQGNEDARTAEGRAAVDRAAAALGVEHTERLVARGDPGSTLCDLAEERSASAIVMGSRGRGGLKRAFLGSVSDHVVRNASCPVVITRPPD